ncbi:MAG: oxidoreductase [Bacteroidota bacterium]
MVSKYLSSLIFSLFIFYGIYSQNDTDKYNFKDFPLHGISVRAIEVVNDTTVWFAGSNGKFGRIINEMIQIDSVEKINNKPLHFRSIAYNGQDIFILSIENPAVLYKIELSNKKIEPFEVYRESHAKVFYDSMIFFDKFNGIAMGDPTEDCLSVIITKDGGNTWQKLSCESLPKIVEGEAAFAASNTNLTTFKNNAWMVTGGVKARVFYSNNKGKNWKVYNTPIVQGKSMTGIFTVDFFDDKTGIIMGGNWEEKSNFNATKAITNDSGKTWKLIANNQAPGYISCAQYIPNSGGKKIIAVSTEGIYVSNNNGNSWKKISNKKYYSIKFIDKNTAWLSGNKIISKLKIN